MTSKKNVVSRIEVKTLEALQQKEKPYLIREQQHDKKDGVLGFRVLPNGDIDGYFIYYVERKERLKKIGRFGKAENQMSLKEIRSKYLELSKEYQSGVDVKVKEQERAAAEERQRQAQAAIERKRQLQGSFQQLIDCYTEHAKINLSSHYYKAIKSAFSNNLKDFDTTKKANEIDKGDIRSILRPIESRGKLTMANRMRSYLSAAFEWVIENEDEDEMKVRSKGDYMPHVLFFINKNPVADTRKPLKKESAKDRFLSESEVYAFWQALVKSSMSVHRKNILRLMLALGCRVEALTGLRWSEIDFNERLIDIPPERSKNKLHWVVPLNCIAFDVLKSNPRLHNDFVFPAENGREPLRSDGINQAVGRLCEQFNIERFTPRDLRTTFKTLAGKAGLSKEIRDRIQNHALTDVSSKHYDRYDYIEEKRCALNIWNDCLEHIIDGD